MTLDDRARQAATGLKSAVATSPISSAVPGTLRWEWVPRAMAALGAAAAIVVVTLVTIQVAPSTPVADTQPPDARVIPDSVVPRVEEPASSTTIGSSDGTIAPAPVAPGDTVPAADVSPPSLSITYPLNADVFEIDVVRFEGVTEPGARVMAGPYEAEVAEDGTWSIVLILSPGSNRAVFVAADEAGNESTAQVSVEYKPRVVETTTTTKPKEPTTTTKADFVEFTANQVYKTCSTNPPYDVFWGTAQPGTKVIVTSDFGSGSVVANADGGWELRVDFPDAPAGKWFAVAVKSEATGAKKLFEFSYQP